MINFQLKISKSNDWRAHEDRYFLFISSRKNQYIMTHYSGFWGAQLIVHWDNKNKTRKNSKRWSVWK